MRHEDDARNPRPEVGRLQLEWEAERARARPALLRRIAGTFDGVRLGGGVSLHQARAIEDYRAGAEVAAARTLDTERDWHEVPDEKVGRLWDTLPFLDAEGFRFYLPRFMTYALRHEAEAPEVRRTILANVEPRNLRERGALVSDEQRAAMEAFVAFFSEGR